MKKLFILTKAGFLNVISGMMTKSGAKTKKKFVMPLVFAVLGLYVLGGIGLMTWLLCDQLISAGADTTVVPILFFTLSSILSLTTALFSSQGFLFRAKDIEMLSTYPVSDMQILCSKFLQFYLYELIFSVASIGVSGIVYFVTLGRMTAMNFITWIIGIFVSPLFPMTIGSVIAYVIGLMTKHAKHKNLFTTFLTLIFFAGVMAISYTSGSLSEQIIEYNQTISDMVTSYYFPAKWFGNAFNGEFTCLVLLIALAVIPTLFCLWLISGKLVSISSSFKTTSSSTKYKDQKIKQKGFLQTCLIKEFKRFFSSSMYVLNCCIGIIVLCFTMYSFFSGDTSSIPDEYKAIIMIPVLIFVSTLTPTTAASISLEANTLWIYKTSPVNEKTVLKAKALVNEILNIPVVIIASTVITVICKPNLLQILYLYAIPVCAVLFVTYLGLLIDIYCPKFNWVNETQAIKQNRAVLFTVLISIGSIVLMAILFYVIIIELNSSLDYLFDIFVVLYLCGAVITRYLLYTKGVKRFQQING